MSKPLVVMIDKSSNTGKSSVPVLLDANSE